MTTSAWVYAGLAALALLLVVAIAALVVVVVASRRRVRSERDQAARARQDVAEESGFLITDAGVRRVEPEVTHAPTRVVVSGPLGEGVLRGLAVAHGLRTALSPANRNRIGFEMKQELRRARKQRRAEIREARRLVRDQQRTTLSDDD